MGELADRLAVMQATASTPDGGIRADLRGANQLTLTFRPDLYQLFDDETYLEQLLNHLATRLWAARTREYWRIWNDVTGDNASGGSPPRDDRDFAWQQERDGLLVAGTSADERVSISAVGMRQFRVSITPGSVRALGEYRFCAAVSEAAAALITNQLAATRKLARKYYSDDE